MAAMALRAKSEEGRRLPRDSDFGLAQDCFISTSIYNVFLAACPAGNQLRRVSSGIEEKGLIGQGEIATKEIDQARHESPSHIAGRNIVAALEMPLPHAFQRNTDVR
jgi:hypothetical protein